ncbi:MAG: SurA N-terminal domain-containing protein [FCB group bacterium]|nr:SurA N-terminal domain-containing protein [FCB group bacterium]
MGIMNKMRQRMGIILIVLLVAFVITIVFDWGAGGVGTFMGGSDVVGVVEGKKVTIKDFYETYNMALEQYRRAGVELDLRTTEMIVQQTWENIVNQILWEKEINRLGIAISDEELFYHLENNPPEFLMDQEIFLTDGVFDRSKYLGVLYNPQGNEWVEVERYLRQNVLPYQKLNDLILSSVVADEYEILQKFIDRHTVFTADYIAAPLHMIPDTLIPLHEEDLLAYYHAHKDERFRESERRNLRIVFWPKIPSSRDSAAVIRDLDEIVIRHAEGESFEDLAEIFSEVRDLNLVGDLGWFAREDLEREYRNPVFSGKTGEILAPIIIGDEYHLIKVSDRKKEGGTDMARISLIVRRIDPINTYNYFASEAEAFILDVEAYGFNKALQNTEARLDTIRGGVARNIPFFGDAGYIPGLARWAFQNKPKKLSPVFENEQAFVVAELYGVTESAYIPFEEVRPAVERAVLAEKKKEKSSAMVSDARTAFLRGDSDLKTAADNNPFLEYRTLTFNLENPPYPVGTSPVLGDIVRNISMNAPSPPFLSGNYGYGLIRLTGRSPLDTELFLEKREELRDVILVEKQQAAFENWMNHLREKAEIKDYREQFGLN